MYLYLMKSHKSLFIFAWFTLYNENIQIARLYIIDLWTKTIDNSYFNIRRVYYKIKKRSAILSEIDSETIFPSADHPPWTFSDNKRYASEYTPDLYTRVSAQRGRLPACHYIAWLGFLYILLMDISGKFKEGANLLILR